MQISLFLGIFRYIDERLKVPAGLCLEQQSKLPLISRCWHRPVGITAQTEGVFAKQIGFDARNHKRTRAHVSHKSPQTCVGDSAANGRCNHESGDAVQTRFITPASLGAPSVVHLGVFFPPLSSLYLRPSLRCLFDRS